MGPESKIIGNLQVGTPITGRNRRGHSLGDEPRGETISQIAIPELQRHAFIRAFRPHMQAEFRVVKKID
jgi:hypothetical protein